MRTLIHDVSEIIRDLQTLNLLKEQDVSTTLKLPENIRTKKYVLTVTVVGKEETIHLCLEMFQKLRNMCPVSFDKTIPNRSTLVVNFYEQ